MSGADEKFGSRLGYFFFWCLTAFWKCPHCVKSHHCCSAFPWHLAHPSASVALSFLPLPLPHRAIATLFAILNSSSCATGGFPLMGLPCWVIPAFLRYLWLSKVCCWGLLSFQTFGQSVSLWCSDEREKGTEDVEMRLLCHLTLLSHICSASSCQTGPGISPSSGHRLSFLKSFITWYFIIWYSKRGDKARQKVNFVSIIPDFGRKGWWQKPRWKKNVGQRDREREREKVIVTCHSSDR